MINRVSLQNMMRPHIWNSAPRPTAHGRCRGVFPMQGPPTSTGKSSNRSSRWTTM